MQIQILRSFKDPDSPRPFFAKELVTVPYATAKLWISEGKATPFHTGGTLPPKQKRERSTKP